MGASNSKIEDDKALQLCRERKKFVRQALDGRCSLASSHVAYVQSLRNVGTALRKFVEPEASSEYSPYTSITATPEPFGNSQKNRSYFSFASPSLSHTMESHDNRTPSPSLSPRIFNAVEVNHMNFRGFSSTKVEEKPSDAITATVYSSSLPTEISPPSASKSDVPTPPSGTPWDYFGLMQQSNDQFSFYENTDDIKSLEEEEGVSQRHPHVSEQAEISKNDLPTETMVRNFRHLSMVHDHTPLNSSATISSSEKVDTETGLVNGEETNTSYRTPMIRTTSKSVETKILPDKENQQEFPRDFISSLREIEQLFYKASETGKEVPRMLEANKLHFRPITPGKGGIGTTSFFKSCLSCGDDAVQVQEEPEAQNSVKYLTWHRTTSSSSSRNPIGTNAELEESSFDNTCMISGSHASTLDRLYAWERKLYDEVKASQVVRRDYDAKCKLLRQLESKGESENKIYRMRADVKDLHSRIRVAIQRIDSISKRIEELRDKELHPQLVELIKGLSRMWRGMSECHKLQLNIISTAFEGGGTNKMYVQAEAHRQITIALESELDCLSSCFLKWIDAQKMYLQAINDWLFKCVFISQNTTKRRRRQPLASTLRNVGPCIYSTCGVWLDESENLPAKEVVDSVKGLAAEINRFLPLHEKNQSKNDLSFGDDSLREEASEDCISRFRSSLVGFLGQLSNFSDCSVTMYGKLESIIASKDES